MAKGQTRKPVAYVTRCDLHGSAKEKNTSKVVRVNAPRGKHMRRFGGCPVCAKLRAAGIDPAAQH